MYRSSSNLVSQLYCLKKVCGYLLVSQLYDLQGILSVPSRYTSSMDFRVLQVTAMQTSSIAIIIGLVDLRHLPNGACSQFLPPSQDCSFPLGLGRGAPLSRYFERVL